jgi:putative Mg2+ transporter-C (MgtC) family protein
MILSAHGFSDVVLNEGIRHDVSRIAAQVVSGIGFIGAGCIIFQKHAVRGLTTAAGLWATAAIGMAAGAGMYAVGVATTIMVIVCLELMNFLHHHVFRNHHKDEYDADED